MERKLPKISVTVPPELLADLDHVAARLGVSRSALVSGLLGDVLPDMRTVLDAIPLSPEPLDMVRFRGASADIVRKRLDEVQELDSDLFSAITGGKDA